MKKNTIFAISFTRQSQQVIAERAATLAQTCAGVRVCVVGPESEPIPDWDYMVTMEPDGTVTQFTPGRSHPVADGIYFLVKGQIALLIS